MFFLEELTEDLLPKEWCKLFYLIIFNERNNLSFNKAFILRIPKKKNFQYL